MKIGDKVTNKIGIYYGNQYNAPLTLIGRIISIGQCLYSHFDRDYMVKSYDVEWPDFKDWGTTHTIKRSRREG